MPLHLVAECELVAFDELYCSALLGPNKRKETAASNRNLNSGVAWVHIWHEPQSCLGASFRA